MFRDEGLKNNISAWTWAFDLEVTRKTQVAWQRLQAPWKRKQWNLFIEE